MATTSDPTTRGGAHITPDAAPAKSTRFKIGLALLIAYPFFYLAIPIAPFLPFGAGTNAAIAGGVVAAGEAVLLIAIALMGKEGYRAIKDKVKARLTRKSSK